ncbi:MAG TPA: hypothetical protein V6D28_06490 [Leptolyngbyaceae cyanobacterium]
MLRKKLLYWCIFPIAYFLFPVSANALPGETAEDVAAWIKGHHTLRPKIGETLSIRRSDTPAHRFIFEASVQPAGIATALVDKDVIRSERIDLFDMINGITPNRLKESLRVIYGLDIYQDFERAQLVYAYPSEETVREARSQAMPLQEALQGELRLGNRFAYWLEIAQPRQGKPIIGQITVLLKNDLDRLEAQLRNR